MRKKQVICICRLRPEEEDILRKKQAIFIRHLRPEKEGAR